MARHIGERQNDHANRGRVTGRLFRRRRPLGAVEAIALSLDRFEVPWLNRIVTERDADFPHCGVDAILGVAEGVPTPPGSDNLGTRDELAAPARQQNEQFHRQALKPDFLAAGAPQFVALDVEFEVREADKHVRLHLLSGGGDRSQ